VGADKAGSDARDAITVTIAFPNPELG
jgi:hypothetical protein